MTEKKWFIDPESIEVDMHGGLVIKSVDLKEDLNNWLRDRKNRKPLSTNAGCHNMTDCENTINSNGCANYSACGGSKNSSNCIELYKIR